jgi:hypothetical protein
MPVKIGTNNQTRLTKYDNEILEATARRSAVRYNATRTGMLRTNAAAMTSAKVVMALTRGSSRCRRPGCAAMSSVNRA